MNPLSIILLAAFALITACVYFNQFWLAITVFIVFVALAAFLGYLWANWNFDNVMDEPLKYDGEDDG